MYFEIPNALTPFAFAEGNKTRGCLIGHVTREFIYVAFSTTDDPIILIEKRRYDVENPQRSMSNSERVIRGKAP